ncbi:MAG: sulfite exporter TauE/SafE family protein [Burkholderiaceae bacterium]|nr:sulfite exporter TauE/SafE family protein [Burkholderiaceae bacterium]
MTELIIAVLAGAVCGFLNTLASSGSAVTLPLLMFMGLSPVAANATNRIPVVLGALIAVVTFIRAGVIELDKAIRILAPTCLGTLLGAYIASHIEASQLKLVIAIAVLIALILLFTGLKKAIMQDLEQEPRYRWQEFLMLLIVGAWLGFIVIDGATYLLLVLVLGLRLTFVQANAYKNLALAVTSAMAVAMFAMDGHIDWTIGLLMGAGSIVGAYLGAKLAMHELAKIWAFRLLVTIIILELINMTLNYFHVAILNT